ncbi:hypothetical protein M3J07_000968 [Ascochyta lentis]
MLGSFTPRTLSGRRLRSQSSLKTLSHRCREARLCASVCLPMGLGKLLECCPAFRLMDPTGLFCQCRSSARHTQLSAVNEKRVRSTVREVVKRVAVSTDSCHDANRPASLVWRIRLYDDHNNTHSFPSSSVYFTKRYHHSVAILQFCWFCQLYWSGVSAPSQHVTLFWTEPFLGA